MAQASVIPFDRRRPPATVCPPPVSDVFATGPPAAALGRRLLEGAVAALALLVLAPVLLGIAALVGMTPGPVLVRRRCAGRGLAEFALFSFRTTAPGPQAAPRHRLVAVPPPRRTRLGAVLERSRLDRLPALLNVLRGDLALIGPPPLAVSEARALTREEQRRRLAVRPGWMAGPAATPAPAEDHPGPAVGF